MLPRLFILISLLVAAWSQPVLALDVPKLTQPVMDLSGVLTRSDQTKISASLLQFQKKTGPQLQVLIIPSLEDETIEGYSIKVVDKWKLGAKGKDNGVLLLVATQNRKVRIEVGRGLEGDLPDALAGRIINNGIVPFFKQGQIGAGVLVGLNMIAESVGGKLENVPSPRLRKSKRSEGSFGYLLFIIIFLVAPVFFGRGRRRGGVGTALLSGMAMGGLMGSSRGHGGFGGGGFGGGGFGGGGGGFSGGGASGGW